MSHRARRRDANHTPILNALRQVPRLCVVDSHAMGSGFPDLIACYRGRVVLLEIKDPASAYGKAAQASKDRSGQTGSTAVTLEAQRAFRRAWEAAGGIVVTVFDVESALQALGVR